MQTPDLNKERLEKLKSLFPDLFTIEGKLNPDELKKIIDPELVKETERFEFKWFGKSEAKRLAFTPSKATLFFDEERSVNPEYADGNMIVEGENLETLKCLLAGYRDRVKCIYIDPPYNTGKDFVYSDRWDESKENYWEHIGVTEDGVKVDTNAESSGRFHSNWLNMMYSRLLLARQLLREDGVIFISIDDNEVHNLCRIMEEVFGPENRIALIPVVNNLKGRNDKINVATCHEYVVIYGRTEDVELFGLPLTYEQKEEYSNKDDKGEMYALRDLRKRGRPDRREDRPNMYFPIYFNPITKQCTLERKNKEDVEIYPKRGDGSDGRWRWGKERVAVSLTILEPRFSKKNERWDIDHRVYLRSAVAGELAGEDDLDIDEGQDERKSKSKSFWIGAEFSTDIARREFKQILPDCEYDYPKAISFIQRCLQLGLECNDLILDFFGGSGTTAQAVMELNRTDSGSRKFILVQIPETIDEKSEAYKAGYKKISDITIERNKRVIQRIEKEESEKQPSLLDSDKKPFKTGFKVYKLAKSNFPRVEFAPDPAKTEEENLALLNKYIDEKEAMFLAVIDEKNIFDEVLLKNGFMLNYSKTKDEGFSKNNVYRITDDYKECLICMDIAINKETLKELEPFKEKIFICLERALDTTMKWNLKHLLGDKLIAF